MNEPEPEDSPTRTQLDFPDHAAQLFEVSTADGQELWARQAWKTLTNAGLTAFSNEVERTEVLVRLICLARIYNDFCTLAFDYPLFSRDHYSEWAQLLDIEPMRVGQLLGRDAEDLSGANSASDPYDALSLALCHLDDEVVRFVLVKSLTSGTIYGEADLFVELYRSQDADMAEEEILELMEPDGLPAFTWLTDRCPPLDRVGSGEYDWL